MSYRALHNRVNGRLTAGGASSHSYEDAKAQYGSNHWSSSENNRNNGRNQNFNNGNANNNNKNNGNVIRAVTAFADYTVPVTFLQSVWAAYHDCLRGKMTSTQAIEYMAIAEQDIPCLAMELWTGTYKPGTSTCFLVKYPKWREVFAANFRDRIVHHWVCMRLEPLFEDRFVSQGNLSFNCRKGFGTEAAVAHLRKGMERISDCYHKPAWIFRGDLVGFFMSIDKDILWYFLERFITRWRKRCERQGGIIIDQSIYARLGITSMPGMYWDILIRTAKVIVFHHPERDCVLNSPPSWWRHLSKNKSLFTCDTGEPIGNLTTQLFANFLMSFFVAYIRFLFRRQNYCFAQFVDDFALGCDNLQFLVGSIPKIEYFLSHSLHLRLHKDKRYLQPVSHGILFVGAFIRPRRDYLSNRTVARFRERCHFFAEVLTEDGVSVVFLQHIEQVLNSYLGFCQRRQTYAIRKEYIESMGDNFWRYFIVRGHYDTVKLKREYKLLN